MNNEIKKAIDVCKKAQRNYDLSKTISEDDLETLILLQQTHHQNKTKHILV